MSVNVGERNVPDTPGNRQLDALELALELSLHTIQLCKNKNVFTIEYQEALTNGKLMLEKEIHINCLRGWTSITMIYGGKKHDKSRQNKH